MKYRLLSVPVGPIRIRFFRRTDGSNDDARSSDATVSNGGDRVGIVEIDFRSTVSDPVAFERVERSIDDPVTLPKTMRR